MIRPSLSLGEQTTGNEYRRITPSPCLFPSAAEHSSGRELIQALQEDTFAKDFIAPEGGIKRATFSETINERGLEQFQYIFEQLQKQAASVLPKQHPELGDFVAIALCIKV